MNSYAKYLAISLALAGLSGMALVRAQDAKTGDVVVTQAWARATPSGAKVGGGYLTITNNGSAPDRLVSASVDAAGKTELHEMTMKNGVMSMRQIEDGLAISPGQTVKLSPSGYHLMLLDLKKSLKKGDKLKATLTFEKAGTVDVSMDVGGIGDQGPSDSSAKPSEGMNMKGM